MFWNGKNKRRGKLEETAAEGRERKRVRESSLFIMEALMDGPLLTEGGDAL